MYPYIEKETVPSDNGQVNIVRLTIEGLYSLDATEACKDEIRAIDPATKMVVDLENVSVLPSTLVAAIVALDKATRTHGGRLCLCRIGSMLSDMLRRLRLDRLLLIRDNRQNAVRAVCGGRVANPQADISSPKGASP